MKRRLISDVIEWDVPNWSRALTFWEAVLDGDLGQAKVLAIGERNGGLSLWFALKGCKIICSDRLNPENLSSPLHEAYQVKDRITYQAVDVFSIPYPDSTFDLVVCKSVIGGVRLKYGDTNTRTLAAQACAVAEIHRVLKPGGWWLGAENMQGTILHQKARERRQKGNVAWRHLQPKEWREVLHPFRSKEVSHVGFLPTLSRNAKINRAAYWVNRCLNPLLPAGWKYIAFIRAQK